MQKFSYTHTLCQSLCVLSMCLSPDKTTAMINICLFVSVSLGHTNRVLSMCLSPDKTTVMSCAGDETLRLWKCFTPETAKTTKKTAKKSAKSISSSLSSMQIR